MRIHLANWPSERGYRAERHGTWPIGETREVEPVEAARLLRDFPGLFVEAPPLDPPEIQRPQPVEHHRQSGRAKPRKG